MKIKNIDYKTIGYIFDGITGDYMPDGTVNLVKSLIEVQNLYLSATREIATKLENLNDEFKYTKDRNPIHQIKTRVKSPKSITDKLRRRGHEMSVESAKKNLTDIAGVRVICSYIDDIYLIADLLTSQDDVQVIRRTDYIKNPKPNGYRSLHLIVTVPVFQTNGPIPVNVEVQIRTIAMDFWASLEHDLVYKLPANKTESVFKELKECAEVIAETDKKMQSLYNHIMDY